MADHPVARLGDKTLLQYARPQYMEQLAKEGRTGRLITVPEGFPPGSEVANTAILGYDLNKVYEGRGPLEAASIGYEMTDDDFAIRCNIITLEDGKIITHNGGNLETDDARILIEYLNEHLGSDRVRFITGIQYRHLLVIKGGNKHIVCAPPHDHPNEPWRPLLVKPDTTVCCDSVATGEGRMTPKRQPTSSTTSYSDRRNCLPSIPIISQKRKRESVRQTASGLGVAAIAHRCRH